MSTTIHYGHMPNQWQFLISDAEKVGFSALGVANASPMPYPFFDRYCAWANSPMSASLHYLKSHWVERRQPDHKNIVKSAKVVISVAFAYGEGMIQDGVWPYIAAHARARDYHKTLKKKLSIMADHIQQQFPKAESRVFVDSAPIMERSWAVLAGIGNIGRNGMLIVPGIGPKVLLGEIICANVPAVAVEPAVKSRIDVDSFAICRECRRCIQACPTNALQGDGTLNANCCLSYLTTEKQDSTDPLAHISKGDRIFGCDRCIDACPYNQQIQSTLEPPLHKHIANTLKELILFSPNELQQRLQGTALYRTGAEAIIKNAQTILTKEDYKVETP